MRRRSLALLVSHAQHVPRDHIAPGSVGLPWGPESYMKGCGSEPGRVFAPRALLLVAALFPGIRGQLPAEL